MPNSAYNFVPLSESIFFPDWSDKVSMDIPFEDGLSGYLEIELENQTPFFTRNSDKENDPSFFKVTPEGNYAIPGTSIKGVIRNVLEIASYSKISQERVANKRYGVRDLRNKDLYTNYMTEPIKGKIKTYESKVKAGWLKQDEKGEHIIIPCEYARIEESEIKTYLKNKINKNEDLNDKDREDKLTIIQNLFEDGKKGFSKTEDYIALENSLSNSFKIDRIQEHDHNNKKIKLIYRKAHFSENNEGESGHLVFTGQCGRKHMEFVFFKPNENSKIEIDKTDPKLYKDFCFIHSDPQNPSNPNKEWAYWKEKLHNGEKVPVFYITKVNGNRIKSFGLAMMFRLAYTYGIHDVISHTNTEHLGNKKDFAETLFGYIDDKDALKGRISFSTLIALNNPPQLKKVTTILSNPKPTFYPYYIKQPNGNDGELNEISNYSTYMDDDSEISGWKRYPIKRNIKIQQPNENNDVTTDFHPLPAHSIFQGKVHFHNLRKCELGALIWALTFGYHNDCYHSVGLAKPYGYGACSIRITRTNIIPNSNINKLITNEKILTSYMNEFIQLMNDFILLKNKMCDTKWELSLQIQNLLEMAKFRQNESNLTYPHFDEKNTKYNEFIQIKGSKKDKISSKYLKPMLSKQDIRNRQNKLEKQKEEDKKQTLLNKLTPEEREIIDNYEKIDKIMDIKKYSANDTNFSKLLLLINNNLEKLIANSYKDNINLKEKLEKIKSYVPKKDRSRTITKNFIDLFEQL